MSVSTNALSSKVYNFSAAINDNLVQDKSADLILMEPKSTFVANLGSSSISVREQLSRTDFQSCARSFQWSFSKFALILKACCAFGTLEMHRNIGGRHQCFFINLFGLCLAILVFLLRAKGIG